MLLYTFNKLRIFYNKHQYRKPKSKFKQKVRLVYCDKDDIILNRKLGESTFAFLERQTKYQIENLLDTKIINVPETYINKFAKDKMVKNLKLELVNTQKLPSSPPFEKRSTRFNARAYEPEDRTSQPPVRGVYKSFSPQRERPSSLTRVEHPLVPQNNISRVYISDNKTPFDNNQLKVAFKKMSTTINDKKQLFTMIEAVSNELDLYM